MQCNVILQQVGWLDGRGVCLYYKGQGIKPVTNGVCMVNNGKLIEYFPI
jgi:hypothetical protein